MQMNKFSKQNQSCLECLRWTGLAVCQKSNECKRNNGVREILQKRHKWTKLCFYSPYYIVSEGRVLNLTIKEKCPGKGASSQPITFSFIICLFCLCICHCHCFSFVFLFVIFLFVSQEKENVHEKIQQMSLSFPFEFKGTISKKYNNKKTIILCSW